MGSGSSTSKSTGPNSQQNKQQTTKTEISQNGGTITTNQPNSHKEVPKPMQTNQAHSSKTADSQAKNNQSGIDREKTQFEVARKSIASAITRKQQVQRKFSRGFGLAKVQARKEKVTKDPHLLGDFQKDFPPNAKIVRIFTSSTFTDTKFERNSWMVNSYPRIQSFCRNHGYEFQVVDMRWGVRDDAADDHSAVDLCLRELEQCQKLSTGPNFVSLLSHKYGYRNLLKQIEAEEFEAIFSEVEMEEDKALLSKWFKRDDNAVPPVYVLQRISTLLPDFISPDNDKKTKAKSEWWEQSEKMQDILATTAEKCLGPEKARNYIVSDCLGDEEKWKKSRQLLSELKDDRMSKTLPSKNIVPYNIHWKPGGIDMNDKEHSDYIQKISDDLVTHLCDMIDTAISERDQGDPHDPLLEECKQHIVFCQNKCRGFQGREDILEKIKSYITGDGGQPLVIHGTSGCGKTSLMAMAAQLTKAVWAKNSAVIIRFLGTTPDSSLIGPLLKSLNSQIRQIYGYDKTSMETLEELKEEFQTCFDLPINDVPLVIFLDSLDQLGAIHGGRSLSWLPEQFSGNIKIVVSTLEDRQYEAFPKLQSMLPEENLIKIPELSIKDVQSIISSWLGSQNRTLTPDQNNVVVKAFNKCPLALFLKLSLDEACQWNSFTPVSQAALQTTVRASINALFQRLEVRFGVLFVSRTLGYLTTSINGLSESELEDILSCDDDVLNDLYQFWTPPIRRLPPLLLVRLKTALQQYLVDRGADGVRVIYWYHRQFIEAAQTRYCKKEKQEFLHSALADFFAGTWSNGNKKPFINKANKTEGSEDRLVAAQPLKFKDSYNLRTLGHLPYHRIKANQLDKVKSECLCNFEFFQTKLIGMGYRSVFRDLNLARNTFQNDKELSLITDAFKLSEYALSHDPYQLAPHMIYRLSHEKVVSDFISQCRKTDHLYLESSDDVLLKPGGELLYTMTGHSTSIKSLDVTDDGSMAVTCEQFGDDLIRTWSLKKGKLVKEYEISNLKAPEKVAFADNNKRILVHYNGTIVIINIADGSQKSIAIPSMCQTCVCGPNKSLFGTFLVKECNFHSTIDGTLKDTLTFDTQETNLFDIRSLVSASPNYVALTHPSENEFYVINLTNKKIARSQLKGSESKVVDAIVITPNQKMVICASYDDPMIRFHDINNLKILKTLQIRNEPYEEISNFHVTRDGKFLYFPCYRDVVLINLQTETETKKFSYHPDSITDVIIYSEGNKQRAVSITQDPIVRVWDMMESSKNKDEDKVLRNHKIVDFKPLPNSRYVVVHGNTNASLPDDYYIYVYDLAKKCIVQSTELDEGSHILEVLDDNTVLVLPMSLKLKTIDLQTMSIKTVFQGKVCDQCKHCIITKQGKGLLCVSRGRRNIKFYNTVTGKVIKIYKSPENLRIDHFFSNQDGTTIVAKADETWIIFNINGNKIKTVTARDLKMEVLAYVAAVSPSGKHVVLSANKIVTTEEWESEPTGFLWDVMAEKKTYQLFDSEYGLKYKKSDSALCIALDEVHFLDDETVVTTHDDYIIRVWGVNNGRLLHRLTGHHRQAQLTVPISGPYFLSYGFMDEEVIKLWDRQSYRCLSSFKFDTALGKLRFCSDNETFVTSTDNPVNIVHWHLHGKEPQKALKDLPEIQRKNYNIQLEIEADEDMADEPSDPDTDPEELDDVDDLSDP